MTAATEPTPTAAESLAGKVAVVTGAARGIGLEVATTLAGAGAQVVISDIDEEGAAKAAASLPGASWFRCDVRDEADVEALIQHASSQHGRLDIVVANAGIVSLAPLAQMSFQTWRELMSINLDGTFLTLKHAALAMAGAGTKGSIITMASVTAMGGTPLVGHYGAAKAGVVSITQTAAIELREAGIRVNAILPGFAETELVTSKRGDYQDALGLDFNELIAQKQGGYVAVEDIARIALFLAGDRSGFCTGGSYVVDGGLTASVL